MTPPVFISAQEAAAMLRMNYKHFCRIIRRGQGPPARKIGSRIRINYTAFMKWATPETPIPIKGKPRA